MVSGRLKLSFNLLTAYKLVIKSNLALGSVTSFFGIKGRFPTRKIYAKIFFRV